MCLLFDRSILVCGTTKGEIRVFDAQDQFCQLDSFSSHKNTITYLYYISSRGILAAASRDSTIALWDVQCYRQVCRSLRRSAVLLSSLRGRHGDVTCLTATSDGLFFTLWRTRPLDRPLECFVGEVHQVHRRCVEPAGSASWRDHGPLLHPKRREIAEYLA